MADATTNQDQTLRARLLELAALFLRLGTTAFGGPAAHIALFEDELVKRRQWITHETFLDLLSAVNFIPGPNSTEMAIHIGYLRAGWRGLIVAGACFILPAAILVTLIAWAYVTWGNLPVTEAVLWGVKPVVIAVIVQALWRLGKSCIKSWILAGVAAAAAVASALRVNELIVLAAAGVAVAILRTARGGGGRTMMLAPLLPLADTPPSATTVAATAAAATTAATVGLWPLFWVFLKIGSVLFGSGYVLLAFLRSDLVDRLGWINEQQLLDATAVGQVTPGPVFTTATFIGYIVGAPRGLGLAGAAVATLGIFLPAFVFVAISGPIIPRLRRSAVAGAFLDGLNVASLALMAVVCVQLAGAAVLLPDWRLDWLAAAIAATSMAMLLWARVNATWLVVGGAVVGVGRWWALRTFGLA